MIIIIILFEKILPESERSSDSPFSFVETISPILNSDDPLNLNWDSTNPMTCVWYGPTS